MVGRHAQPDVAANVDSIRAAKSDNWLRKRVDACKTRTVFIFVTVVIFAVYIASPYSLTPFLERKFASGARRSETVISTNGMEPTSVQPPPAKWTNTSTTPAESTLTHVVPSSTTAKQTVQFNGLPIDDTRVAFCVCGTARTFHYGGVHKNIMNKMVKPIRATHKIDIFFIVRMDDDAAPTRPIAKTEENKTYEAMHLFDPVSITTYTDMTGLDQTRYREKVDMVPVHMISPKSCGFEPPKILDLSHTMFRTRQCLDIVSAHEQKQGFRYAWMYRVRTDTVIIGKGLLITPPQMKRDVMYVSLTQFDSYKFEVWWKIKHDVEFAGNDSIGDQFFAGSRQVAEVAFKSFNIMDDCEAYEMPQPNIESSLRMWYVKHNITYYPMPWMWVIIRDSLGPLCHWLDRLEVPNTSEESRKEECESFWKEHGLELPGRHPDINYEEQMR